MAQPSGPMLDLRAAYMGSRSMRAGMSWLVFGFWTEGTETLIVFEERMGVDRPMAGRLRAAGLMSTMAGAVLLEGGRRAGSDSDNDSEDEDEDSEDVVDGEERGLACSGVACEQQHRRDAQVQSFAHQMIAEAYAIVFPTSEG